MHLMVITNELATSNNSSGGLASFSANLARIFKKNGHVVTIVLVTTQENEIIFDEGIDLYNIHVEKPMWDKFEHMAENLSPFTGESKDAVRKVLVSLYKGELVNGLIQEIHHRKRVDIIHICNLERLALGLDGSIPYVVRISSYMHMFNNADKPEAREEYYDESLLALSDQLDIYLLQKSRYIVSPSNLLAEIGKEKIGINPKVIESPFFLDRDSWDDSVYRRLALGKRYIIHYGRMSYRKGTHIVAEIAERLLEDYPDIYLLLAGASEKMENAQGNTQMAHELVMQSAGRYAARVIYAGCPVREQLYPMIDNAELCLLPSRIENLSNACVEAMAMGKIVIAAKGASFEQLIDDRECGFLCERDNPEAYLRVVEEALSMGGEIKRQMGLKAARQVQRLAPDVIYQKYYDFYQTVISKW